MPLGSWFSLHFYGPGAGATVATGAATAEVLAASGVARAEAIGGGAASPVLLDATRLVDSPFFVAGAGAMLQAAPKGRARASLVVRVNELSQDDVTGAVLEAEVEPGLSLREAMRLVTAALAGKVSGAAGTTVTIRDVNDAKNRIVATVDANGNRTAVTLDASV
jgi:hypothetical protein